MAKRQRVNNNPRWPSVAAATSLPNVSGSPTQSSYLEVGDTCFVTGTNTMYVCSVATLGASVWAKAIPNATASVGGILTDAQAVALAGLTQSADPLSTFPSYGTVFTVTNICHFTSPTVASGAAPFSYGVSGGSRGNGAAVAGRFGIENMNTSSGSASFVVVYAQPAAFVFGSGVYRYRADIQLSTASDGTDTYTVRFGFNDSAGAPADGADGAFFRYTHSVNGGKWGCVTRSNSVETASDSGVAAISASYQSLEIEVNATGTSVAFYINGTLVATNTTNIPTGTARATGATAHIVKSLGTTARGFEIDLMAVQYQATAAI